MSVSVIKKDRLNENVLTTTVSSGNPLVLTTGSTASILIVGMAQGVGTVVWSISRYHNDLAMFNVITGQQVTPSGWTLSLSGTTITLSTIYDSKSHFLVLASYSG